MSGGRVELGLGAGWFEAEHTAYGIPFPPLGERFDRLEEQLADHHRPVGDARRRDASPSRARTTRSTDSPGAAQAGPGRRRPRSSSAGAGQAPHPALAARYADEFNCRFPLGFRRRAGQFERVRAAVRGAPDATRTTLVYSAAQVVVLRQRRRRVGRRAAGHRPRGRRAARATAWPGPPPRSSTRSARFAEVGATPVYLQVLDLATSTTSSRSPTGSCASSADPAPHPGKLRTNSLTIGQKCSGASSHVKWPAPGRPRGGPVPRGRAATISSAAATGVTGSSSPTTHERRGLDLVQLVDDVDPADELHAVGVEVEHCGATSLTFVVRMVRPERGVDLRPLVIRHLLARVAAPGEFSRPRRPRPDGRPRRAAPRPTGRTRRGCPDPPRGRGGGFRRAGRWRAQRVTQHDGCTDPHGVAEVRTSSAQPSRGSTPACRPSRSARVHAGRGRPPGTLSEATEVRFEVGVVERAGTAVNQDDRRAAAGVSVRDERGAPRRRTRAALPSPDCIAFRHARPSVVLAMRGSPQSMS